MGVGLRIAGDAAKRGLIPRLPAPDRLLADIETWLRADAHDQLRSVRRPTGTGHWLIADLHPAAPPVRIGASEPARVTVHAETSGGGPGYHTFVAELVRRLGRDLAITWLPADPATGTGDDTTFFPAGTRAAVERVTWTWLSRELGRIRDARAAGCSDLHLSLPDTTRFTFDGALATVLGPRDDAWLETAIRQPPVAADVLPWFADATDARYLLNRALCLMWTEVRWRPPAPDERGLFDEVLGLLRHAYPLEPGLAYPWREWLELVELRGVPDPTAAQIAQRARQAAGGPPVGYRRRPVRLLHEGWSVPIPGSFAERRTAEELWAGEAGRSVTLAAVATGRDGVPMPPNEFLAEVAGHLGDEVLRDERGPVRGKARIAVDTSSGLEVGVLEGYSAVIGSGCAIRIGFDRPDDWTWAVETWRSLRHEPGAGGTRDLD